MPLLSPDKIFNLCFTTGSVAGDYALRVLLAPQDSTSSVASVVSVANFPSSQTIDTDGGALDVNFPATQTVDGTVDVGNWPANYQVSNFPATQSVHVIEPMAIAGIVNAQLTDTLGYPVTVEQLDEERFLSVSMVQDVHTSPGNSSSGSLAGNTAFTGSIATSLGTAAVQVNLKADQNCLVSVDQSIDGSNWDITDTYNYYYSLGGNSWTVQMTASYFRVRVLNLSSTATTVFRLQTAVCPIVEAVPRSLSARGNLKTSVEEMLGTFGTKVQSSPMGQLRVVDSVRLIGATFSGAVLDPMFWGQTAASGSATATVGGGQVILATGTTPTGTNSIILNSMRTSRYVGGSANYFRGVVRCPAVTGTNMRRWGAFDVNDGFFFQHDGTTFKVGARKAAVDNLVATGSFNGEQGAQYGLDANVHTCEIYWTNSSTWFMIDNALLHKMSGTLAPLSNNLNLRVGLECTNGASNANNNTLNVRTATINRLGQAETMPQWRYSAGSDSAYVLKYGPGILHRIIVNTSSTDFSIYDGITAVNPIAVAVNIAPGSYDYNLPFYNGLCYTTGASKNTTIVYE